MSSHRLLVERILEIVRCEPQCDLDELILSCGGFPWREVWCEIAHLQRAGIVTITSKGGEYIVRPSSLLQEGRTVSRENTRLRCRPRIGSFSKQASPRPKLWTFACQSG